MKAKIGGLEHAGAFDDQEDPVRVARGVAYGLAIGAVFWLLAAAVIAWLI